MTHEIIIYNTNDLLRVSALDVMAIKANGNFSIICFNNGDEKLVTKQLGDIEDIINLQLADNAPMFIRVGRSVIINFEYIYYIDIAKKQLIVRSKTGNKVTLTSSKESLKKLKNFIEMSIGNH